MLNKEPYGRGVDWWGLGCVLYEMLFGLPPFYDADWSEMYVLAVLKTTLLRVCVVSLVCTTPIGLRWSCMLFKETVRFGTRVLLC
jgi:serine/threonine protein kinase